MNRRNFVITAMASALSAATGVLVAHVGSTLKPSVKESDRLRVEVVRLKNLLRDSERRRIDAEMRLEVLQSGRKTSLPEKG